MTTADPHRISEALSHVPPDDREVWLRMGMAVKAELGEDGHSIWDTWSQRSESYRAADARAVWKSIRPVGGVTVGTLLHEAKAHGWRDNGIRHQQTPEEMAERQRSAHERQVREQAEMERGRAEAANKAAAIWAAATDPAGNGYLERKKVAPVPTLREIAADAAAAILGYSPKSRDEPLTGRLLVVPIKAGDELSTCELIDGDGRKHALAGGAKKGGYWASDALPAGAGTGATMLIGEGVATCLSAKEATGHPAVAALTSGNLPTVARMIRERHPSARLIILADLIKDTGEPDHHAAEAARNVGGLLAVPDFGAGRPQGATDFNDLSLLRNPGAVKQSIELAALKHDRASPATAPSGGALRNVVVAK
uniref:PriCT-2 domain-containing protein n=1 Tax=uncultured Thiohalocapsa sp. TaxID=768990 RepID=UPI0025FB5CE4